MNISWKELWDAWNIRIVLFLSFFLQVLLIFFAPLRKRVSTVFLTLPLWSAYVLVESAANFALGHISYSQGRNATGTDGGDIQYLHAFWAPFLLVHLGGPDTISAFALEDNALWYKQLLRFMFQIGAVVYVLIQTFPGNNLWIPTVLIILTGLIKYGERIRALHLASHSRFRESMMRDPDPGPDYAKLMDDYSAKKAANLPATMIYMVHEFGAEIGDKDRPGEPRLSDLEVAEPNHWPDNAELVDEHPAEETADLYLIHEFRGEIPKERPVKRGLSDLEVVEEAYYFYEKFKGLIVDLIFDFRQRNESRNFFLHLNSTDAFRVIETELNFIFDVLYTKVTVVNSPWGYARRAASFILQVFAGILVYRWDKRGVPWWDIGITYTFLLGALQLDLTAFLILAFSDWTAVALKKKGYSHLPCLCRLPMPFRCLRRRWAESVSQFNLIDYCIHARSERREKTYKFFGMADTLDAIVYVGSDPFTTELKEFIHKELKVKSFFAKDLKRAKEMWLAKGEWTLRVNNCSQLLPFITDSSYDECLLIWHIATELCYNQDLVSHAQRINEENEEIKAKKFRMPFAHCFWRKNKRDRSDHEFNYRQISKVLSDYMLYLLVMKPSMLSTVAGIGQIRFRDTCAEAKGFFRNRDLMNSSAEDQGERCWKNFFSYCFSTGRTGDEHSHPLLKYTDEENIICCHEKKPNQEDHQEHKRACNAILSVNTVVKPALIKGDQSKSVLFDGRILAEELENLEKDHSFNKWEILSEVWVEMLSYAAINCKANNHCRQLSKGGELITLVWLLMTHFGFGNNYQIREGHARTELVVDNN